MELNLQQLQKLGAFVPAEPVKTSITWSQRDAGGEIKEYTADVYIKRNSCATFERDIQAARDGNDPVSAKIASTVCDSSGTPIMEYAQAQQLNEGLAQALIVAIAEVNGSGEKNSQPSMKSGTSLPDSSAAAPSKN